MSIIWRKVWRDLWANSFRTMLVVSTGIGVFALGLVFGLSGILRTRMTEHFQARRPAHVTISSGTVFGQETVEMIRRIPGVAEAEGDNVITARWRLEGEASWRDGRGQFDARDDYGAQQMNLVGLVSGDWPGSSASNHSLAVDVQSSQHFGVSQGATIIVEVGRSERRLPVEAIVRCQLPPACLPPIVGSCLPAIAGW